MYLLLLQRAFKLANNAYNNMKHNVHFVFGQMLLLRLRGDFSTSCWDNIIL